MNARVFLLALVTIAFMAIWDADHPVAARAALAQSKFQNDGVPTAGATHDALIPPAKYLQPGTWQAISLDGDTLRITIERNKSLTGSTSTDPLRSEDPKKRKSSSSNESPDDCQLTTAN